MTSLSFEILGWICKGKVPTSVSEQSAQILCKNQAISRYLKIQKPQKKKKMAATVFTYSYKKAQERNLFDYDN